MRDTTAQDNLKREFELKKNQFLNNMLRSAQGAHKVLMSAQLASNGWSLDSYSDEHAMGPVCYYYVYDEPTGWTWMCTIPEPIVLELTKIMQARREAWSEARGALGDLIKSKASGQKVAEIKGMDWENQLAMAICAYSATTKVLELAGGAQAFQHFIVLNYRGAKARFSMLRPFMMPAPLRTAIPEVQLTDAISQVVDMDRDRHPEWFKS